MWCGGSAVPIQHAHTKHSQATRTPNSIESHDFTSHAVSHDPFQANPQNEWLLVQHVNNVTVIRIHTLAHIHYCAFDIATLTFACMGTVHTCVAHTGSTCYIILLCTSGLFA